MPKRAPAVLVQEQSENPFAIAIEASVESDSPFRHWTFEEFFSRETFAALLAFPLRPMHLGGVSGRREYHNEARQFFDASCMLEHTVAASLALAFQSSEMARRVEAAYGIELDGTFVRLEYAQDVDGFWLEPHTDVRAKRLSLLVYLSGGCELGTDLYAPSGAHACRVPFVPNCGLAFVPHDVSWHGFDRRRIRGVRRTLILNYVGPEWAARHELSFPNSPVRTEQK